MELTQAGSTAILTIDEGRGNAMSPALVSELRAQLSQVSQAVEQNRTEALIVTGAGRVFSAGLALPELITYERSQLGEFMSEFSAAMRDVLCLPVPTVAAVNGHAIAGGCVLALMCDHRLMVKDGARIGLTEVQLGISLPSIITQTLLARLSPAAAHTVALGGSRFDGAQATRLGLINETVAGDELIDLALSTAEAMIRPGRAYGQIKADLLAPTLAHVDARANRQLDDWLATWFSPPAQTELTTIVEQLRPPA